MEEVWLMVSLQEVFDSNNADDDCDDSNTGVGG